MTQQHYRITLKDAIAHYQAGDLTAKGLVHFYLKIKLKAGWKLRLNHKEVCKTLGIQKTAFYNAISRLKAEGSIDWEAPEGILVSISGTFRECGNDSATAEYQSAIAESEFANAECQSAIAESEFASAESKSPKPPSNNDCGDPPNSLTNSYQIFINSLSESERENFLNFVREQIKNLPKQVNDVEAWLANQNQARQNRWEVYYNNFLASQKTENQATRKNQSLAEEISQRRQKIKERLRNAPSPDSPSDVQDSCSLKDEHSSEQKSRSCLQEEIEQRRIEARKYLSEQRRLEARKRWTEQGGES